MEVQIKCANNVVKTLAMVRVLGMPSFILRAVFRKSLNWSLTGHDGKRRDPQRYTCVTAKIIGFCVHYACSKWCLLYICHTSTLCHHNRIKIYKLFCSASTPAYFHRKDDRRIKRAYIYICTLS